MNEDAAQEIRIEHILGEDNLKVSYQSLTAYRTHIQNSIEFPCDVTGREDFPWEEIYIYGSGDKNEYAELKKSQPSYTDIYTFMSFDNQIDDKNGLMVKVKRLSDSKEFVLPLADLKVTGTTSSNHELVHDYAVWFVNH
ncbi:MAG TPA: hypothetical protein DDY22_02335 [Geobacter sp.]|nr:MAG: hypothetical protein A2076_04110 [Geobacteraceae bacterium GWC2_53_11]HBG04404.1 hypothetical protein [Geobacter sp.]